MCHSAYEHTRQTNPSSCETGGGPKVAGCATDKNVIEVQVPRLFSTALTGRENSIVVVPPRVTTHFTRDAGTVVG